MLRNTLTGLIFLFLLSFPLHVSSAEKQADWQFNLAPFYLWGINIDGDVEAGPLEAQIDIPFDDIFDSMEAMFVLHFEGLYREKWGLIVDIDYLDLENTGTLPNGISQKVGLDLTLAEFSGLYRMGQDEHVFDFIAGLRYLDMENSVSLQGVPVQFEGNQDWIDPLVGARWIWSPIDKWSLVLRGDIGGFGVGSDLAYHVIGVVEWQPWKHASFLAGYRVLDVDYEDGSGPDYFSFDATIHGPVLGLNFKW